ncbi:MAG: SDR family NAD(P)-dependent oxidoreductase [Lachnospiraceae bacterium]|nr:SDR family NAD(P)-dependent oxidoreductase [Lachnospiraceae bacterium]
MKTALITGASRGIGKAIAEKFAKEGYCLYLTCSKDIDSLNEYSKRLSKDYGVNVNAALVDGGNFDEVKAFFEKIDSLDVLVNNAGISYVGLLSDMTKEEWDRIMAVNLDSVFHTCKFAVSLMLKKHQGSIINISSVWGNIGASTEVAYSASKGGVNAFTKALAKELAPSNISVNALACGFVDTDMNKHLSKEDRECLKAEIPADRFTDPLEVSDAVYKLATMPPYLTGQIVTMDGGWT